MRLLRARRRRRRRQKRAAGAKIFAFFSGFIHHFQGHEADACTRRYDVTRRNLRAPLGPTHHTALKAVRGYEPQGHEADGPRPERTHSQHQIARRIMRTYYGGGMPLTMAPYLDRKSHVTRTRLRSFL